MGTYKGEIVDPLLNCKLGRFICNNIKILLYKRERGNLFYVSLMNLGFLFSFKLMAQKKLSSMIGQRQEKNLGKREGYLLCAHVLSIDI